MNSRYNISDDGTIFQIKEDGSIAKLAKIDSNGHVSDINSKSSSSSSSSELKWWFFVTALVVFFIMFISFYTEVNNAKSSARDYQNQAQRACSQNNSLQQQLSRARSDKAAAERELSEFKSIVGQSMPIIITDVEMGNDYTSFGAIYSSSSTYLTPRLTYIGISSGTKTIYIKIFRPSGALSTGSSSPYGYSYSRKILVNSGKNTVTLTGWGNQTRGHWESGNYRIEFWYNNSCLKSYSFRIY